MIHLFLWLREKKIKFNGKFQVIPSCKIRRQLPTTHVLYFNTGVTEIPMQGAIVGELFANIIGDGFSRLMRGDRLHFENTQGGLNTGKSAEIMLNHHISGDTTKHYVIKIEIDTWCRESQTSCMI